MEFPRYLVNSKQEAVKVKTRKEAEDYPEELRATHGMWKKDYRFDVISFGKKPVKRVRKKKDADSERLDNGSPAEG